ncbi:type I restriction-modification system subunit M N-terminal domain-containing protein [Kocuria sp.]|uniref:type I restriction-modification system subunit M N-terminal domain-containing protein n=1 Tax=Kocuria sp. TaxID=1871328 RepID=UPI0026DF1C3D|nr:type I restriction-modification system subunit M N-terminal domain-containing protein [Kocuria sp.]MDO5619802.1 type I restriction-modification system subunit M N-terminal domain-containing protein [Kocuria sp.]
MFNHASFIWAAADLLRGTYKQHEYGEIILPFTVLARLDAVLAPTKEAVLTAIVKSPGDTVPSVPMPRARAGHHYDFFNVSHHSLKMLQGDPDNVSNQLAA